MTDAEVTGEVVVNNGASYGPGGEGFVRLNVGCPRIIVEEAFHRIEHAVARLLHPDAMIE